MSDNQPDQGPLDEIEADEDAVSDEPTVRLAELRGFAGYVWRRFGEDRCLRMSAGLSYTSLLAIVPLTAIAFSMLAAFPVFGGVRGEFQNMLFANFLPESASAMRSYFDQFISNSATLSAVGVIGLAMTAVLLLGAIEADMNAIFRVSRPRALAPRLLVFWALITLGPLLLGASFSLSTYFFAATKYMGVNVLTGPLGGLAGLAPTAIIVVLLTMFFYIIPNRPVSIRSALVGGAFAGIGFSVLRKVFAWYVSTFPAYQTIYGAVSVVPIFLVWMYLTWTVVLLGAVLAASLDEWRRAGGLALLKAEDSGRRLVNALKVLARLQQLSQHGTAGGRRDLLRTARIGDIQLEAMLRTLNETRYITETRRGRWVLARDLGAVTLHDLYRALGLGIEDETLPAADAPWTQCLATCLAQARTNNRDAMNISLRDLLEGGEADGRGIKAAE